MIKKPRNFILDLLRFLLVILVINENNYIATRSHIQNILYHYAGITVPLFIVLSFFLGNKLYLINNVRLNNFKLRLKRLFIPFCFWSIVGFLVSPNFVSIGNIPLQLLTGQVVNDPLYYIVLLIWFSAIFWFINYKFSQYRISIYIFIIIISLFLQYTNINFHLFQNSSDAFKYSYGRFAELIPYASIGILLSYILKKIKSCSILLYISLIFLLLYIIIPNPSDPLGTVFYGGRLLAIVISIFSMILWFSNNKTNLLYENNINLLGKYSFGVYLLHYPLLILLVKFFPNLSSFIIYHSLIFLIVYVPACYILCALLNLITNYKLSFLVE